MELKGLLSLLEERLVQHDNNRKEIQSQLQELTSKVIKEVDSLEEKISEELQKAFDEVEERTLKLIGQLNDSKEESETKCLIKQARRELLNKHIFKLQHFERASCFTDSYKSRFYSTRNDFTFHGENDIETIINKLQDHLNRTHESLTAVLDEIAEICTKRRNETEEMEERINKELESLFSQEDRPIQDAVCFINERIDNESPDKQKSSIATAKVTLIKKQEYTLGSYYRGFSKFIVGVKEEISLNWIDFEERKPTNIIPSFTDKGELSLTFTIFSDVEIDVLKQLNISFEYVLWVWEKSCGKFTEKVLPGNYNIGEPLRLIHTFKPDTTYCMKMRLMYPNDDLWTQWSDETTVFTAPDIITLLMWREIPDVDKKNKFECSIGVFNPKIVKKVEYGCNSCCIIGNTPLPLNKVISWNIKILNSKYGGDGIRIGVVPLILSKDGKDTQVFYGWEIHCYDLKLWSGHVHDYPGLKYDPKKEGKYVHNGDIIGVIMDTTKGELSFVLNGVNLGVAYKEIPFNRPIVPCVRLTYRSDSIELVTTPV